MPNFFAIHPARFICERTVKRAPLSAALRKILRFSANTEAFSHCTLIPLAVNGISAVLFVLPLGLLLEDLLVHAALFVFRVFLLERFGEGLFRFPHPLHSRVVSHHSDVGKEFPDSVEQTLRKSTTLVNTNSSKGVYQPCFLPYVSKYSQRETA